MAASRAVASPPGNRRVPSAWRWTSSRATTGPRSFPDTDRDAYRVVTTPGSSSLCTLETEDAMKAPTLTLALALALCGCNRGEPAPSPVVQPVEEDVATVPERFRGDWAADADACTTPGHVSRLHIGSDRIRFHESEGPIVSVDERGD